MTRIMLESLLFLAVSGIFFIRGDTSISSVSDGNQTRSTSHSGDGLFQLRNTTGATENGNLASFPDGSDVASTTSTDSDEAEKVSESFAETSNVSSVEENSELGLKALNFSHEASNSNRSDLQDPSVPESSQSRTTSDGSTSAFASASDLQSSVPSHEDLNRSLSRLEPSDALDSSTSVSSLDILTSEATSRVLNASLDQTTVIPDVIVLHDGIFVRTTTSNLETVAPLENLASEATAFESPHDGTKAPPGEGTLKVGNLTAPSDTSRPSREDARLTALPASNHESIQFTSSAFPPAQVFKAGYGEPTRVPTEKESVSESTNTFPSAQVFKADDRERIADPTEKESESEPTSASPTAQVFKTGYREPTGFPSEKELESESSEDESFLGVTFDPDGMTHNYSQNPDAIVFAPSFNSKASTSGHMDKLQSDVGVDHFIGSDSTEKHSLERETDFVTGKPDSIPPATTVRQPASLQKGDQMLNDSPHLPETGEGGSEANSSLGGTEEIPFGTSELIREPLTEQSAIRPVTVASPLNATETAHNQKSLPTTEIASSDNSSPTVLSNPSPDADTPTTIVLQPELTFESNASQNAENISDVAANETIAGMAVKTSVSVSIPLLKNESVVLLASLNETASSEADVNSTSIPVAVAGSSSLPSSAPEAPPTTQRSKILKPKIRIPGRSGSDAPLTRKPFTPSQPRPTSTVGAPVSIFRIARTRIDSITSSTTAKPFPQFSTIRVHYASRIPGLVPNGEMVFSLEPVTTTEATTTETEEPFFLEPYTGQTQTPSVANADEIILIKVAGTIALERGMRWTDQLNNRHSPQYKERARFIHLQLEKLFHESPIAQKLWKIQIDGFSGKRSTKPVYVDFYLFLMKSEEDIRVEQLVDLFHDKLVNNSFSRFTIDPLQTTFKVDREEPLVTPTPPPEGDLEPPIPQWAIAVIVIGAASLIFIVLFAAVTIYGRHSMQRRYSNKLREEDSDRPSEWESKMAAAYENLAADTIYDVEDLQTETYKKSYLVD